MMHMKTVDELDDKAKLAGRLAFFCSTHATAHPSTLQQQPVATLVVYTSIKKTVGEMDPGEDFSTLQQQLLGRKSAFHNFAKELFQQPSNNQQQPV